MFWVQIKSTYYSDVEKLLKKVTGATRVHIFDHTLRKGTIKDSKYVVPSLAVTSLTQCNTCVLTSQGTYGAEACQDIRFWHSICCASHS